ncbi:TatD family deoxyribonuclease [Arcanobacterium haemolyticum]|uniref:TatD family hydrolase n=1 Tax=Arcanobacterium haemolyticum TaxID=28264 RepID=UPI001110283B|nr:TatD family hydrolase [Arcanobacterium haemolyticum]QCX47313.1 TatD family deoxyribonuclease [Arcanobacterium haemolyticum]
MGNSQAKKEKRRLVLDVPDLLPVPIVDNHTHISPDPVVEGGAVQNVDDSGNLRMPVLLDTLRSGMAEAGVRAAITSGCEVPMLDFTHRLAQEVPEVWAALAIHPNDAALHAGVREVAPDGLDPHVEPWHEDFSVDDAVARVAELSSDPCVVAVGETGLDYFRTGEAGKQAQKDAFRAHIALAKELGKPLQIHDRDAHADVIEILRRDGAPERTVFHCFSGDADMAQICAEEGWYASFAGPLTYSVNMDLQAAFDQMPDHLILVETDAPYLTPVPFRGQPNAAWGVGYTVRYMAERRNVGLADWCSLIDQNTVTVYGI